MAKVGIFFGTDTGSTRKVAKLIAQKLGDSADKPLNVNRIDDSALLAYDYLILGTPTLGSGLLPGLEADCELKSWAEFLEQYDDLDLSGKKVALFGMGDQVGYPDEFVDGLGELFDYVEDCGAELFGRWPNVGYEFNESAALDGDEFVGLVVDKDNQASLTDERVSHWVEQVIAEFGL
ncbi:flavodoxin [Vibrio hippocampi]|uniref:Flavodoxin n=1 Tax=Vibrio hippocampi TaxID=654686 RepID=A0ABN8DMC4_9VIBR|nr:flavodoxin [Vibrio hippocampi]CAH0529353.1 Flavodoxin 2 [Vibrio hippocampi]